MKELRQINKVQNVLATGALQDWYQQGNQLKRLFGQLEQKKQMLQRAMPQEKVEEIPGQEDQREEEEMLFSTGQYRDEVEPSTNQEAVR